MSLLSRLWASSGLGPEEPHTALIVGTTVVTTLTVLSVFRYILYPDRARRMKSPLHSVIPRLSTTEIQRLEYNADYFPGARDVPTPYGSIRVYEWGPEDGPKVLFIHGITTTCMTLTRLAHGLVAKGCRVMLFDLFGRGFSDGVGDVDHDERLYVSQVLMVLASSPLSWTGDGAFRLVGYSMGGGIAVHFAASFGRMVESLVLLAPSGLIRLANFGVVSRFLFSSGVVPERPLRALTRWRLQQPLASSVSKNHRNGKGGNGSSDEEDDLNTKAAAVATELLQREDPVGAAMTEAADPAPGEAATPLEKRVLAYTRWMAVHHPGFVPAFLSSIRFAPLAGQERAWARLAEREAGATALIFGREDQIVAPRDYEEDALPLLGGKEKVVWRVVAGSHDFPMTHSDEVLKIMYELWDLK